MVRLCTHCHKPFGPRDLAKNESKDMEADRKAYGLRGVRFLYFTCPECGFADIFVDILQCPDDTPASVRARREAIKSAVRDLHPTEVEVVVGERPIHVSPHHEVSR